MLSTNGSSGESSNMPRRNSLGVDAEAETGKLFVPRAQSQAPGLPAFFFGFSALVWTNYVMAIVGTVALVIGWICLMAEIESCLPRTFSWELLVRFLGSHYDDCVDYTGPKPIPLAAPDMCKMFHSFPVIPVLALVIHVGQAIFGALYPVEKLCFSRTSSLTMKAIIFLSFAQIIFSVVGIVRFCLFISNFETSLLASMKFEMSLRQETPLHISPKWELLQEQTRCCGIEGFTDWTFHVFPNDVDPRYPMSCCDPTKSKCRIYPSRRSVFGCGCFQHELATGNRIAGITLALTIFGLLAACTYPFLFWTLDSILFPSPSTEPTQQPQKLSVRFSTHVNPPAAETNNLALDHSGSSKNMKNGQGQGDGDGAYPGNGAGDGDQPDSVSVSSSTNRRPSLTPSTSNPLQFRRQTTHYFTLNRWGLGWRIQTSSERTPAVKKETLV